MIGFVLEIALQYVLGNIKDNHPQFTVLNVIITVWIVEYGLIAEYGMWSMDCGVRNVSMECGVWIGEYGLGSMDWGAWIGEYGLGSMDCGEWNVEYGLWRMECGVWIVENGMWRMERGVWTVDYICKPVEGVELSQQG